MLPASQLWLLFKILVILDFALSTKYEKIGVTISCIV